MLERIGYIALISHRSSLCLRVRVRTDVSDNAEHSKISDIAERETQLLFSPRTTTVVAAAAAVDQVIGSERVSESQVGGQSAARHPSWVAARGVSWRPWCMGARSLSTQRSIIGYRPTTQNARQPDRRTSHDAFLYPSAHTTRRAAEADDAARGRRLMDEEDALACDYC